MAQAGGGWLPDSDPAAEYQEALDKMRALFRRRRRRRSASPGCRRAPTRIILDLKEEIAWNRAKRIPDPRDHGPSAGTSSPALRLSGAGALLSPAEPRPSRRAGARRPPHRRSTPHFAAPEWIAARDRAISSAADPRTKWRAISRTWTAPGWRFRCSRSHGARLWFGENSGARRLGGPATISRRSSPQRPTRRFAFHALPVARYDGALAELAYGLDTLKAEGVGPFSPAMAKMRAIPPSDPVLAD